MKKENSKKKESERIESVVNLDLSKKNLANLLCLSSYAHVRHLNLSDNKISTLHGLDDLRELEYLNLSANQIFVIQGLNHLLNLKILNIRGNQLKKIENLHNLIRLEVLDLSGNNITKIENFEDNINLKCILLQSNCIKEIENIYHLSHITTLDLRNNAIQSIENIAAHINPSISTLNLENNKIRSIISPFYLRKLNNLKNIVFQGNPFVTILQEKKINSRAVILYLSNLNLLSCDNGQLIEEDIYLATIFKNKKIIDLDNIHIAKNKPSDNNLIEIFKNEMTSTLSQTQMLQSMNNSNNKNIYDQSLSQSQILRNSSQPWQGLSNSSLQNSQLFYASKPTLPFIQSVSQLYQTPEKTSPGRGLRQQHAPLPFGNNLQDVKELKQEIEVLKRELANSKQENEFSEKSMIEEQSKKLVLQQKKSEKKNIKSYTLTLSYDKRVLKKIRKYYEKLLEIQVSSCVSSKQQAKANKSLILLQSWFRGHLIRDKIILNRFIQCNATKIQGAWKGHRVRKVFGNKLKELHKKVAQTNEDLKNNDTLRAMFLKVKDIEDKVLNFEEVIKNLIGIMGQIQEQQNNLMETSKKNEHSIAEIVKEQSKHGAPIEREVQTIPEKNNISTNTELFENDQEEKQKQQSSLTKLSGNSKAKSKLNCTKSPPKSPPIDESFTVDETEESKRLSLKIYKELNNKEIIQEVLNSSGSSKKSFIEDEGQIGEEFQNESKPVRKFSPTIEKSNKKKNKKKNSPSPQKESTSKKGSKSKDPRPHQIKKKKTGNKLGAQEGEEDQEDQEIQRNPDHKKRIKKSQKSKLEKTPKKERKKSNETNDQEKEAILIDFLSKQYMRDQAIYQMIKTLEEDRKKASESPPKANNITPFQTPSPFKPSPLYRSGQIKKPPVPTSSKTSQLIKNVSAPKVLAPPSYMTRNPYKTTFARYGPPLYAQGKQTIQPAGTFSNNYSIYSQMPKNLKKYQITIKYKEKTII